MWNGKEDAAAGPSQADPGYTKLCYRKNSKPCRRSRTAEEPHDVHEEGLAVMVDDGGQGRPLAGDVDKVAEKEQTWLIQVKLYINPSWAQRVCFSLASDRVYSYVAPRQVNC